MLALRVLIASVVTGVLVLGAAGVALFIAIALAIIGAAVLSLI